MLSLVLRAMGPNLLRSLSTRLRRIHWLRSVSKLIYHRCNDQMHASILRPNEHHRHFFAKGKDRRYSTHNEHYCVCAATTKRPE